MKLSRLLALITTLALAVSPSFAGITIAETDGQKTSGVFLFGQGMSATDNNGNTQTVTRAGFGTNFGSGQPPATPQRLPINELNTRLNRLEAPTNSNPSNQQPGGAPPGQLLSTGNTLGGARNNPGSGVTADRLGNSNSSLAVDAASRSIATVSFDDGVTTVAALAGEIKYTDADGKVTTIDIGTGLIIDKDGNKTTKTLSELIAAEKASGKSSSATSLTSVLNNVVAQLAANTASGKYGANSGALLAAAVKVAGTANPDAAVSYAQTTIAAIAKDKSLTPAQKQAAVAAVAEASLGTATTPEQKQALASAIQEAADKASVVVSTTPTGPSVAITPPVDVTVVSVQSPSS